MFFYRRRPCSGCSPAAGCLGALLVILAVVVILIVCAVYIGTYVLLGLLIIGTIVGGATAIFSLFKALPQTVRDIRNQTYSGNKAVVLLKTVGYFFVCLAKYSIGNDIQYARNAFQRFSAKRFFSFSKWVNFALGITVLIFGLLALAGVLILAALFTGSLLLIAIGLVAMAAAVMIGIGLLYNVFLMGKEAINSGKQIFSPLCFKFTGHCFFADLISVPKTFMTQMGKWIARIWLCAMGLLGKYKSWFNTKHRIWYPLTIAFIVACPIATLLFSVIAAPIAIAMAIPVYLVDAIWILIKAVFKF